jgi:hypothetical protein
MSDALYRGGLGLLLAGGVLLVVAWLIGVQGHLNLAGLARCRRTPPDPPPPQQQRGRGR